MDLFPKGKYRARADRQVEFGTSGNGSDYCVIDFEITEGELRGDHIKAWLYFTEKARDRSIEALRTCGCTFPGNDVTNTEGIDTNEVEIVVEHETYEGKLRDKVKWINSLRKSPVKDSERMDPHAKKSFAERMKASLIAKKVEDGLDVTAKPTPGPSLKNDKDLPF